VTHGREARVWATITARSAGNGGRVSPADLCHACAAGLGLAGAAITLLSAPDRRHVSGITGKLADALEDLQAVVGEGPINDAWERRRPVLIRGLASPEHQRRWPAFAQAAAELGAGAVFAFPLQVGAIRLGVLSMYREAAGPLTGEDLADALVYADAATILTLEGGADDGFAAPADLDGVNIASTAVIYQATGMVSVQLGTSVEEAFVRMRAYAYAHDRRLADVARDVVGRLLRMAVEPENT
jgi:hypothetical protein